eukprot:5127-Heterococcus_DN1.PRE.3
MFLAEEGNLLLLVLLAATVLPPCFAYQHSCSSSGTVQSALCNSCVNFRVLCQLDKGAANALHVTQLHTADRRYFVAHSMVLHSAATHQLPVAAQPCRAEV